MTEHNPVEVNLHRKSRLLEIIFDSGENFKLGCEYLRIHGKSAEIKTSELPVAEKIDVNIDSIEAQGSYALRLFFDDGYEQGIYSWETLYELGKNQHKYWADYLTALDKHHLTRAIKATAHEGRPIIKILYFMDKLIKFTEEEEQFELPQEVNTIGELFTILEQGDEIALIPKAQ